MAKTRLRFRCIHCAEESPKWAGRCGGCGEWNSMVEELDAPSPGGSMSHALVPSTPAVPIDQLARAEVEILPTGVAEFDRVLGGGLAPGSVTLIGGEPGIGKSTLLLQLLAGLAASGQRVLYVTGEESADQVRQRAERVGALVPQVLLTAETTLPVVLGHLDATQPAIVAIDSIQTMWDPDLGSAPGSVGQVRECAHRLTQIGKERGLAVILVGHVTKDGALAGPRVLEHIVDTVLSFEGDRHHGLRLLRATKHRFGATHELGLFEMGGDGLLPVQDPSGLFLSDRRAGIAGSVVMPTLEGRRPLLVEIQALVGGNPAGSPRRSAQGIDAGRMNMVLAVLERRCGVMTATMDTYAMAAGGARVHEPAADLAIALAVVSSLSGTALPDDLVACGEIGLGGELRAVTGIERRLLEAARLGFRQAVVPPSTLSVDAPIQLIRLPTLAAAVVWMGVLDGPGEPHLVSSASTRRA